jgi:hypothetical protein
MREVRKSANQNRSGVPPPRGNDSSLFLYRNDECAWLVVRPRCAARGALVSPSVLRRATAKSSPTCFTAHVPDDIPPTDALAYTAAGGETAALSAHPGDCARRALLFLHAQCALERGPGRDQGLKQDNKYNREQFRCTCTQQELEDLQQQQ